MLGLIFVATSIKEYGKVLISPTPVWPTLAIFDWLLDEITILQHRLRVSAQVAEVKSSAPVFPYNKSFEPEF